MDTARRRGGATLIELVVVIVLTAILAGGMSVFLKAPLEAYAAMSRRAALVDVAESALRRMARDARRALPNSVRVAGGGAALELLHAVDGVKYRRQAGTTGPFVHDSADGLSFAPGGDDTWNVLGRFGALAFTYGVPLSAGHRVAVYPTGAAVYADAELGSNPGTITPAATSITVQVDDDEDQVVLDSLFTFRFESPQQRLYIVDTPVTYLCDLGAGTLTRYSGYPIRQTQPILPTVPPLSAGASARVADRVTACVFSYQPGTSQRSALVTLELTVAEAAEQVRLLHQMHVENAP